MVRYDPTVPNKYQRGDGTFYCPLCSSTFHGESAFDLHQEWFDKLPSIIDKTPGWKCYGRAEREKRGLVYERGVWYTKGETA
jgi:hypothetical protein